MKSQPFVSVIVPAFNARPYLEACLEALLSSSYEAREVIVVDDASTDTGADYCQRKGVRVLRLEQQSGPAAARNHGARIARGEILFFIDSDVVVREDTVAHVVNNFIRDPNLAAVFGSYDTEPEAGNFLSQYKNLYHHFVHQQGRRDAETFWAGCGAIRREAFEAIGGFDQTRYAKPSIEDIELGYRLRRAGHRILLDKDLQVKHLKRWDLGSLIRADVFYRAVPWSRLLMESREVVNDLNLRTADRVSAGLVGLSLLLLILSPLLAFFDPRYAYLSLILFACCLAGTVLLNRELYKFFARRRGYSFAAAVFPVQFLYYFYSAAAYVFCWCERRLRGARQAEAGNSLSNVAVKAEESK